MLTLKESADMVKRKKLPRLSSPSCANIFIRFKMQISTANIKVKFSMQNWASLRHSRVAQVRKSFKIWASRSDNSYYFRIVSSPRHFCGIFPYILCEQWGCQTEARTQQIFHSLSFSSSLLVCVFFYLFLFTIHPHVYFLCPLSKFSSSYFSS